MSTKVEATIEDLYKVEGKAELVNGEILIMSPTGITAGISRETLNSHVTSQNTPKNKSSAML